MENFCKARFIQTYTDSYRSLKDKKMKIRGEQVYSYPKNKHMTTQSPKTITLQTYADKHNIADQTVYNAIKQGRIPGAVKIRHCNFGLWMIPTDQPNCALTRGRKQTLK